ncbi:PRC-barrel domain-containing protein [Priestia flexa]|jgi:uncharacterized protein YrrD|uniref:PRC-barrel domain-containing protein n=1 Tax=Priestia flexa TaxID=86664 RepID=A0A1N6SHJ2_9BACI|nr:PRC-barrel domain-containing protein [Priestia flexa]MBN8250578.1 PRC-barrel domain-containing protein [Priestia flexa]MBN8432600.1 PRC-barrel domain-containing protein [Priestia flexa]MBY6085298.1 PRC-barrel domain-containing protein [Priestia flexa]MCA0965414.1 PRC-barrel domain-containing protein [Priestia flexa]MCA1200815.1 PRC-barrel domain-containing protein [Priestia flexa]
MKKSVEILNLPVISISEGEEIGQVKSLIINPEKFSVDFLTTQQEEWQVGVKAIPFKKVIGVGEYAVTVEHGNAIMDLSEIPIANQLFNKKVGLIGSRVMTRKGHLLGEIIEYHVNDDNGQILGLTLKMGDREVILPMGEVVTLGKQMVIVTENAEEALVAEASELKVLSADEEAEQIISVVEAPAPAPNPTEVDNKALQQADGLKEKQVQLLIGKTLLKDIHDQQGNMLFEGGTTLKREDVEKAQEEGPSTFVELSMNVTE